MKDFHDSMGRIFNLAIVDIIGTIILSILLSFIFKTNTLKMFIALIITSQFVHFYFKKSFYSIKK